MFEKKKRETLPEDHVSLKPLFGIRPGVYLAALYGAVCAGILFFTLVYPGLANPGAVLVLNSEPSGAAARIDGVYWGTTPCEVFVPKGTHRLTLVLPGFAPHEETAEVGGRLFGSLLFPLKKPLRKTLTEAAAGSGLLWSAAEYAAWSFTGEPTAAYQIPQILSEGAYRSGQGDTAALDRILKGAARFTATRAGLRDLIRAKHLVDNQGLSPSPVSALYSLEEVLAYLSKTPETALWLADMVGSETAAALTGSSWYARQRAAASSRRAQSESLSPRLGGAMSVGQLTFREIAGGTLVLGGNILVEVAIHPFSIAESAVTVAAWEAFLRENPTWSGENSRDLAAQGLVTEDYLAPAASSAISGVSWYAARAYCRWLTSLLPPNMAAEIRLPTEAEWEYAAKAATLFSDSELWEWCEDPYAPNNFLPADADIISAIGSPERLVRGSGWLADSGEARGSLPPETCSSFGSFRPVLVPNTQEQQEGSP
ncbi:MAG: SUMF1/EgtB/PvdO family nonheme iron enzyme [Spirochaetaceae bacterium]|jgi:hypothetical protein|nr:SUMF1/EgtB/PvdO family nonheme iron enzyme [Spirochaetaceae bacterium]